MGKVTLASITEKRNRQLRDAVNKAARQVINHCLKNQIGTIVFGWNKGMKDGSNLGGKTNQKFVQIPTARLKERVQQLCEIYGIQFVETEESYTSKASFVDHQCRLILGRSQYGCHHPQPHCRLTLSKLNLNSLVFA